MDTLTLTLFILATLLVGMASAVIAWLAVSNRIRTRYTDEIQALQTRQSYSEAELRSSKERLYRLEGEATQLHQEKETLLIDRAKLTEQRTADADRLNWLANAQQQMREAFEALASQSLQNNAGQLIETTKGALMDPLHAKLQDLERHVRELEQKREGAYVSVSEHLNQLAELNGKLQQQTQALSNALHNSSARGRWGEVQLRRIIEMAGMHEHIAFDEQVAMSDDSRPDMLIHLPNGASIPIDSKAPMAAYLDSLEASDDATRRAKLDEHVRAVRSRVKELSQKRYWEKIAAGPDFVIMFMPSEASLSAAFASAPGLLEEAFEARIVIATPTILLALLKAIALGWQQTRMNENAQQIASESRELLKRLAKFADHSNKLSKELRGTVDAYNDMVGSLQSRVVPTLRRLETLSGTDTAFDCPDEISLQPRMLTASELVSE